MFVDEIRRQAETAPRAALPVVTAALWRAFAEGHVSEAEAEALIALIEGRQVPRSTDLGTGTDVVGSVDTTRRAGSPRNVGGSRPRTAASLARRRRWAASGRLPPTLAAQFTAGEQAALAFIAAECVRRGDCRLAIGHIAAASGVSETTVRNALREARRLGLMSVEERRLKGYRNDTNIMRVISPEWATWLRLGRRVDGTAALRPGDRGGGCKFVKGTNTRVLYSGITEPAEAPDCYRGRERGSATRLNQQAERMARRERTEG